MKTQSKELKSYYRSIKRELLCSHDIKARILSDIEHNVDTYLSENPEASVRDIQSHFGTPQQIATSYVEELGAPELMSKLRIRRRILILVAAVLAIGLIAWATTLIIASIDSHDSASGYSDVYVTED